jgi:hypothetical protein
MKIRKEIIAGVYKIPLADRTIDRIVDYVLSVQSTPIDWDGLKQKAIDMIVNDCPSIYSKFSEDKRIKLIYEDAEQMVRFFKQNFKSVTDSNQPNWDFIVWYSGMKIEQVKYAYERYLKEVKR